jgi:hypothetical protein
VIGTRIDASPARHAPSVPLLSVISGDDDRMQPDPTAAAVSRVRVARVGAR